MPAIQRLLSELRLLTRSDENLRRQEVQRKLAALQTVAPVPFNSWDLTVGFPIVVLSWCDRLGRTLDLERISQETGPVSMDYAARLVEFQLRQKIERFKSAAEEIPIEPAIHTNLGLCWTHRLGPFGERYRTDEGTGAFVNQPFVRSEADLDALPSPHFRFDDSLHEARAAVFAEIVEGELPVIDDGLPGAAGAPFSTANNLVGVLEVLEAFLLRPRFIHRLMDFVVQGIIGYTREMREALGGATYATFGCDEVSCNVFSSSVYEEFILPYEIKAAAAFDSIYYHSCGNLTPIFDRILRIPHLHRVHVSPWSDMERAVDVLAGKVVIEKHLEPTIDLDKLSVERMRDYVRQVADLGTDYPLEMVVPTHTPGGRLYRKLFHEEASRSTARA